MGALGKLAIIFILILLAGMALPFSVSAQVFTLGIDTPGPGEVLQGLVTVNGTSEVEGFLSADIAFSYANDPTGTWFLISASSQPVQRGLLATWDTTTITDGTYNLRLRVTLADGSYKDSLISDLRVRNYTPVETATPAPYVPQATPAPTVTPTATPFPTPTRLPSNAAALTGVDVSASLAWGGLGVLALVAFSGLYLWLRRKHT
jgi:hypothetical protein